MTRDSDDEALSWHGDDDPTLAPGWKTVGNPVELSGGTEEPGDASSETDAASETTANAASQSGSVMLVVLGVLGGVYLIHTIGWLVVATTPTPTLADPVAQFMYGLGRWVAVAAPALWFGAVMWLTVGRRGARLAWLIAGAVLLIPVPFLLRG